MKLYRCNSCAAEFPKWEGRCRDCGAWGSLKEAVTSSTKNKSIVKPISFTSIGAEQKNIKISSGSGEFDRVLGGGFVPGIVALVGGEPGIGKSTLLLQVTMAVAQSDTNRKVLYVSGEESGEQIKNRLDRLGVAPTNLQFLGEPTIEAIREAIENDKPALVIVDSLQTIRSSQGTTARRPSEMTNAIEALVEIAKVNNTPLVVIGHVTKEGAVAGPKLIEHLVDAVFYFESGEGGPYRLLRPVKNRYGGVGELGVWKMTSKGLEEVQNPSAAFLGDRNTHEPGAAIGAQVKGTRVFFFEVQALVTKTRFGYPQRRSAGYELNRLQLLIAVLSKRLSLPLAHYDVHLNIVGGLRISEPSTDLPVALAIYSALKNKALSADTLATGEVGLQGEIRAVTQLERQLYEAARIHLKQAMVPAQELAEKSSLALYPIKRISDAIRIIA